MEEKIKGQLDGRMGKEGNDWEENGQLIWICLEGGEAGRRRNYLCIVSETHNITF